jgi:hypothetical protein
MSYINFFIHLGLIFTQDERYKPSFCLMLVDDQFPQHHLWKMLSFLHCRSLLLLSKIRWLKLCSFISGSRRMKMIERQIKIRISFLLRRVSALSVQWILSSNLCSSPLCLQFFCWSSSHGLVSLVSLLCWNSLDRCINMCHLDRVVFLRSWHSQKSLLPSLLHHPRVKPAEGDFSEDNLASPRCAFLISLFHRSKIWCLNFFL